MSKKRKVASEAPPQGIQELVWVDPRTLEDNPLNWKIHPESQRKGLGAAIKTDGWADALVYNRATGRLINGHGRKEVAINAGWKEVPVLVGEWTEEAERRLLHSMDVLGAMYSTHSEKFANLTTLVAQGRDFLDKVDLETKKTLESFMERTAAIPDAIDSGDMSASPLPLTSLSPRKKPVTAQDRQEELDAAVERSEGVEQTVLREDIFFPAINPYGIPDLLFDMLATVEDIPDRTYSRTEESSTSSSYYCHSSRPFDREERGITGGVLGFYCEDYRFEQAYDSIGDFALALRDENWNAIVAPDFSMYEEWPYAVRLWNLYRSRHVARYWQEVGIKVIPSLSRLISLSPYTERKADLGIDTIPELTPVVATQCRTILQNGGDFKAFANWLSVAIEKIKPQRVIIYGGNEHQSRFLGYLPKQHDGLRYILLNSFMAERRKGM